MSRDRAAAVVLDTMAVSALVNAPRNPERAAAYRRTIGAAPIVVSFVTVTEMHYGALRAGGENYGAAALNVILFVS